MNEIKLKIVNNTLGDIMSEIIQSEFNFSLNDYNDEEVEAMKYCE